MPVMTIDSLSGLAGRRKRKPAKRKPAKRKKAGLRGATATCKAIKRVKRTRTVWVCRAGTNASTASRKTKAAKCRKKKIARTEFVCADYVRRGQPGYKSTSQMTKVLSRAKEAVKRSKGRKIALVGR